MCESCCTQGDSEDSGLRPSLQGMHVVIAWPCNELESYNACSAPRKGILRSRSPDRSCPCPSVKPQQPAQEFYLAEQRQAACLGVAWRQGPHPFQRLRPCPPGREQGPRGPASAAGEACRALGPNCFLRQGPLQGARGWGQCPTPPVGGWGMAAGRPQGAAAAAPLAGLSPLPAFAAAAVQRKLMI